MALFVGTSGWAYPEWRGRFYPKGVRQSRFLEHYARELSACEVNTTFYRVHPKANLERWAAEVPDTFRFAVKAHRRLTHRKQIAPDAAGNAFMARFFDSLEPLGARLSCFLFQFPEFLERDDEALAAFRAALPDGIRAAFEFRHPSWHVEAVTTQIAGTGGTVCLSELMGEVPGRLPPGPFAYVRLRAPEYPDAARQGWLELLREESGKRDVFAFAKHEGVPAGNPYAGVGLAQWLVAQGEANKRSSSDRINTVG
jgi:uncharacterized protein YecE (DUF72 family)